MTGTAGAELKKAKVICTALPLLRLTNCCCCQLPCETAGVYGDVRPLKAPPNTVQNREEAAKFFIAEKLKRVKESAAGKCAAGLKHH